MKKILFVCSGNTCRSPMAVSIFKKILKDNDKLNEYQVQSAGLNARVGDSINVNAVEALKEFDIPVVRHTVNQIDVDRILKSDFVITMTTEQRDFLKNYTNVYSLGEITKQHDILDPYGEDKSVYKKVCECLINQIGILFTKLENNEIEKKAE